MDNVGLQFGIESSLSKSGGYVSFQWDYDLKRWTAYTINRNASSLHLALVELSEIFAEAAELVRTNRAKID